MASTRKQKLLRLRDTCLERSGFLECIARTEEEAVRAWQRHADGYAPSLHTLVISALTYWDMWGKGRPRDWHHVVEGFRAGDRLWLAITAPAGELGSYRAGTHHLCIVLIRGSRLTQASRIVDWELFEPLPKEKPTPSKRHGKHA